MKTLLISFTLFASSMFLQLNRALATPPKPCLGKLCDILIPPPTPANRLAKIDVSLGFGAKSFYEIPNYSYLTSSVEVTFTIPDQGKFQFDHSMHGMNPSKYMVLKIQGADRKDIQHFTVTNPDGRIWDTTCATFPADFCTLQIESTWTDEAIGGDNNIRHVTVPGRYLVKAYYSSGPTKTMVFWATAPAH